MQRRERGYGLTIPDAAPEERDRLLYLLDVHGRPMSDALLAGRLRGFGLSLARSDVTIAHCLALKLVRRLEDGRLTPMPPVEETP
ncbi:hypothetical protein [Deinococcus multiflagellatus]|uniref:Uncharacterized protein n=1 Tax=Deinococcus multiflagellatus TaxID=1656887 RepID=A0ABW1ZQS7_9DEIO